jgi:fumarate reductase flavoprotein subunit
LAQPGGVAWCLHDDRLDALGRAFKDYRDAIAASAIRRADDLAGLAAQTGLPIESLAETIAAIERYRLGGEADPFGRDFSTTPPLAPPYCAVKVTGALFHTQGGLAVDGEARVLRRDGTKLPNILAGGGAARGISGSAVWGYLSGNGLLSAVTFGRIAGESAARILLGAAPSAGRPVGGE